MVDTVRTLAALQALLADNVAGDISAQDVRDFLISAAFSGASVYKSANQDNIADTAPVKVTWDNTEYDTDSYFDDANDRFVVPVAGKYRITAHITRQQSSSDTQIQLLINGVLVKNLWRAVNGVSTQVVTVGLVFDLAASDYIETWVLTGTSNSDIRGGQAWSTFQIERLGF